MTSAGSPIILKSLIRLLFRNSTVRQSRLSSGKMRSICVTSVDRRSKSRHIRNVYLRRILGLCLMEGALGSTRRMNVLMGNLLTIIADLRWHRVYRRFTRVKIDLLHLPCDSATMRSCSTRHLTFTLLGIQRNIVTSR